MMVSWCSPGGLMDDLPASCSPDGFLVVVVVSWCRGGPGRRRRSPGGCLVAEYRCGARSGLLVPGGRCATNSAAWCTFLGSAFQADRTFAMANPEGSWSSRASCSRVQNLYAECLPTSRLRTRVFTHQCKECFPEVELGFSCSKQNVFAKSRVVRIRMRNASGRLLEHKWARMLAQPVANCSFPVTISSWPHHMRSRHTPAQTQNKKKHGHARIAPVPLHVHMHTWTAGTHTHTDRQRQMRADTPGT